MELVASEFTGRHRGLPFFRDVRVDNPLEAKSILSLHRALLDASDSLETESRFLWLMARLIRHYADTSYIEPKLGREKQAIEKACRYIEENSTKGVSLNELAGQVGFSPYHFLRVFHAEVGMPPYEYLENVRIRFGTHHAFDWRRVYSVPGVGNFEG